MATGKRGAQQQITAAERQRRALELRKGGASLRAIGDALGCSYETARGDIAAALADLAAETRAEAEQLRALEVERLNAVMLGHWRAATTGGDPDAARIVLRCIEQRVKLLGLAVASDAPDLGGLLDIVLRWSDGRIIDVPPAHDYAAGPASLPGPGGGEPGALQGAGGGPEVGQVQIGWGVLPDGRGDGRAGLVGSADLPAERDGVAGAESIG
jgi:DNA-binding CsgD family transcriptional regulator